MVTDWVLFRRAAAELERELRGGRILDAGVLDDGRFALKIGQRRGKPTVLLAVDPFGTPPLFALEPERELAVSGEPGWSRAAAAVLRGTRIGRVRSRTGDRVIVIEAGSVSRFGVAEGLRIVLELIPRFGNVLVLRDRQVLAAAKQFSPAENQTRSIAVGTSYTPPPLDAELRLPRILESSLAAQADQLPWENPAARAQWIAQRRVGLLSTLSGETDALGPVYAYREHGALVSAHVVPLQQFAHLEHVTVPSVLPLLREAWTERIGRKASDASERRRSALQRRLAKRLSDITHELAAVRARRNDAAGRDALRLAGNLLYTYGSMIADGATSFSPPEQPDLTIELDPDLDAKANAAAYFLRYRKATDALPHLERRIEVLTAKRESLEALAFEADRADGNELVELQTDLDELDGKVATRTTSRSRARQPLRIDCPSGARIYVGRSPRENVEVTFKLARPNDLWFHARGIPGSHVVYQSASGAAPDESELALAADLAARHSRARNAARVEIDFTERKHVRKQRDAAPGLVWYTHARTRVGYPDHVAE